MKLLVTGGAGFIGSNFLHTYVPCYRDYTFINVDKLTYAGQRRHVASLTSYSNYFFEVGDIAQEEVVNRLFEKYNPDQLVHFAAETHVDRSIKYPRPFIDTNIVGTFNLLEGCRRFFSGEDQNCFYHISTDEVYGSLEEPGPFTEGAPYRPQNPYAATKAASDHLVRSYANTYQLPVIISHSTNNYGPYQYPEKLIPFFISRALQGETLPIYGEGKNVRSWLYVSDHCQAIWLLLHQGRRGETYHIGGEEEWENKEVAHFICEELAAQTGTDPKDYQRLISFVADRPGHDYRYGLDSSRIRRELNWSPQVSFSQGLEKTITWYLSHQDYLDQV